MLLYKPYVRGNAPGITIPVCSVGLPERESDVEASPVLRGVYVGVSSQAERL